jgi:UDP-N-acetyl-D-glucosamine dehydrogenase
MFTIKSIESKIKDRTARICIVGQGYVGLPLAIEFVNKGFTVLGYDIDRRRIEQIRTGEYFAEDTRIRESIKKNIDKKLFLSSLPEDLIDIDVFIICVPTPIDAMFNPDMTCVTSALETVSLNLNKRAMVVLESTTYPTTLENVARPILEHGSKLVAGQDFYLLSSPERIDPGNMQFQLNEIPKIVGGINDDSTRLGCLLYSQIKNKVVAVDSPRIAEAAKILENTFRLVNISLVNELAKVFEKMDIDTYKVIDAAATKPFGYMPFYPGAGAGGHCIPIDAFYMSHIAKKYGMHLDFIRDSGKINLSMQEHVISLIWRSLNREGKSIKGSRIAVLGLSYKPNIKDTRNAASTRVIRMLEELGAEVVCIDPVIETMATINDIYKTNCDCVVILVKHDKFVNEKSYLFRIIMQHRIAFVDCVNLYESNAKEMKEIFGINYIGLGKPFN